MFVEHQFCAPHCARLSRLLETRPYCFPSGGGGGNAQTQLEMLLEKYPGCGKGIILWWWEPSEAVKRPWDPSGKSYLCVALRARVPGRRSPVQKPRGSQQDPERLRSRRQASVDGAQSRGMAGGDVRCRQGQILWGLPGRARGLGFILSVSGSHWRLLSRRVSRSYLHEKQNEVDLHEDKCGSKETR